MSNSPERKWRRANKRKKRMKINVTQKLMSFDGEVLEVREKDGEDINLVVLTFKRIATNALMLSNEDDKVSGEDKLQRFKLASKIHDCEGDFDFSLKDLDLIKDQVTKHFTTIVTGAMWQVMEEKESKAVEETEKS